MMGKGVLVIDDNPHFIELVRYNLEREDIFVKTRRSKYYDAREIAYEDYKIIISQFQLPGSNGLNLCRSIKSVCNHDSLLFVLLVSEDDAINHQDALNCGVNDVFMKPVRILSLVERIKTFLNMDISSLPDSVPLDHALIENATIDKNSYRVIINDESVRFTFIEFNLFKLFLCNPGKLFTYGQLYLEMNAYGFILGLNSIQFQVNILIKKLNKFNFRFVNVQDVGFKLEIA